MLVIVQKHKQYLEHKTQHKQKSIYCVTIGCSPNPSITLRGTNYKERLSPSPSQRELANIHAHHKLTYTGVMYVYRWASQIECTKIAVFSKGKQGGGGGGYMTRIGRTCGKEKFIVQLVAIIFHLVLCAGRNLLPCSPYAITFEINLEGLHKTTPRSSNWSITIIIIVVVITIAMIQSTNTIKIALVHTVLQHQEVSVWHLQSPSSPSS